MTEVELKEIEARLNAATPGPWYVWETGGTEFTAIATQAPPPVSPYMDNWPNIGCTDAEVLGTSEWLRVSEQDLELMAHAPDDIRKLLDEVDYLWAVIDYFKMNTLEPDFKETAGLRGRQGQFKHPLLVEIEKLKEQLAKYENNATDMVSELLEKMKELKHLELTDGTFQKWSSNYQGQLTSQLAETELKLATCVEALEFYAQHDAKLNLYGASASQYNSDRENYQILADKGEKARAALEKVKREK